MAKLESALSAERCLKEDLIRTKDELATKLQSVEEFLTAECNKLRTELGEVNVQLEASYQSCGDLEQSLASEKSEKEVVLKEKDALSCQLVDLGEALETMTKEIKEKDESVASIQVHRTCMYDYVCANEILWIIPIIIFSMLVLSLFHAHMHTHTHTHV